MCVSARAHKIKTIEISYDFFVAFSVWPDQYWSNAVLKSDTEAKPADDIDEMEEVVRFAFVMEFCTVSQKHSECFRLKCQKFSTVHWVSAAAQCLAHKFDCWRVSDEDEDDDDEVKEEFLYSMWSEYCHGT